MDKILNVVVVIVIAWLIFTYLIPMLGQFAGLATLILVIAIIVWLMKLAGIWF